MPADVPKTGAREPGGDRSDDAGTTRRHVEDTLDEALDETFPASDPVAMLEPTAGAPQPPGAEAPRPAGEKRMTTWTVRASWREDETEATEEWIVEARTVQEAVALATAHLRFPPHHLEARESPDVAPGAAPAGRHVPRG